MYPYFLSTGTASRNIPHISWTQVVTSDGSTELFRIFWTFSVAKTLADRFIGAAFSGEAVSFRVVVASTGQEFTYSGTWRYSSRSGITASTFATTTTRCCFSADDGVWGAGNGEIDGYNVNTLYNSQFWGVGNFDGSDNGCRAIYRRSATISSLAGGKTYMYYAAGGSGTERFAVKFQIDMVRFHFTFPILLCPFFLFISLCHYVNLHLSC
jgi:hypothetical protein